MQNRRIAQNFTFFIAQNVHISTIERFIAFGVNVQLNINTSLVFFMPFLTRLQ